MKLSDINVNPFNLVLFFFAILMLGLIFRPVAFIFFMALLVAMLIGSVYFIYKYLKEAQEEKEFISSMDGSVAQNLELCKEQISKNKKEMLDIKKSIFDLKQSIDNKMEINENTLSESQILISGFERELDLRKAKLDFYKICKTKIKNIHYNQQLAEKVAYKKEKLKRLQEDHFDDLAEMERMKSDMEFNKTYIDTINRLSLRMAESTSLSSAQELHDELKLINDELREL